MNTTQCPTSSTLPRYFEFSNLQATWRREIIAGLTTFLTMVYIVMVNPAILSAAGIPTSTAFVATCLVASFGSILCGLLSNYPIALAPAMSLNAYFAFSVVKSGQLTLEQALAAVTIAGIIFFLLTVFRIRKWLILALPESIGHAIGAGIGLFIGFIGLKQMGIIVPQANTLVTLGNIINLPVFLGFIGFCAMIILDYYRIPGAVLFSILGIAGLGHIVGLNHMQGFLSWPQANLHPMLSFHDLANSRTIMIIFTFLLVALFDSTGTLLGLLHQAKLADKPHIMNRMSSAFYAESLATMLGGFLGTSTTGPYVENATGIAAGGRTGITAIVVGILFLLTLFFAPLASAIPVFAYAPALLFVATKMCSHLGYIQWNSASDGIPAVLIILLIPLTFSIANGIACGYIVYVIIQATTGKLKTLRWQSWMLFAVFVIYLLLMNR
jgi:AGZA family xanthine/uracil permease-like MFS transporter